LFLAFLPGVVAMLSKIAALTFLICISTVASAAPTEMITYKGGVAVSDLAQVMANRYGENVTITRAQIRAIANPETRIQKFVFRAVIGGKNVSKCVFVRARDADGIACSSLTAKYSPIRINWKRDLAR
jgi:hypothetical protein